MNHPRYFLSAMLACFVIGLGIAFAQSGSITTTQAMNFVTTSYAPNASIESVVLTSSGELHVYRREPSQYILTSNPPIVPPDTRWKEVFVAKDGKIVYQGRVDAKVIPATPERLEWPKD